jgi:hypothetical protein
MSIESPKFEKIDKKTERKEEMKKKIRAMTAWGVITLSSFGALTLFTRKEDGQKYKPKAIIADIEKKQLLSEFEKAELSKKLEYLKKNFSDNIFSQLQKSVEANKESISKPIEIKGFEKIGLRNEDLQKLWSEKYYPKGWLDDEISDIEYRNEEFTEKNMDYGRDKKAQYAGTNRQNMEGKSEIRFYASNPKDYESMKDFIETLDWHFSHESSHANDWEGESRMDYKKRVDFLYEVSQNCFKEDAFRDILGYVDSIKNKDKNKENYYKVREYWGACCEDYFTFPEILKQGNPREFEMVDKYVKMEDPNYNPIEKQAQRQEIINQMAEK